MKFSSEFFDIVAMKDRLTNMSGPIDLDGGESMDKCLTDLTLKLGKRFDLEHCQKIK